MRVFAKVFEYLQKQFKNILPVPRETFWNKVRYLYNLEQTWKCMYVEVARYLFEQRKTYIVVYIRVPMNTGKVFKFRVHLWVII